MSENRVEELVRTAVAHALERQLTQLRETVVQEVLREIGPSVGESSGTGGNSSAALQKAVSAIQAGATQKEILAPNQEKLRNRQHWTANIQRFVRSHQSAGRDC